LRDALTVAAAERVLQITAQGEDCRPVGELVNEKAIVNGVIGLLATGGSTNHTLHLVAIARAAGIVLNWSDFDKLSKAIPSLTRIYPNGSADVNHFHAAGGMTYLMGTLLDAGLLHDDVMSIAPNRGLSDYRTEPFLDGDKIYWQPGPETSLDTEVLRSASEPFSPDGGLRLVEGNLGRGVIKVSAVKAEHRVVEAPAIVFSSQSAVNDAFKAGLLNKDFVAVVRFQGPKANGMPELHKLTPALGVLQDQGFNVALVTDGRMSGASGKVPAAIHVSPESADGGPLLQVQTGDLIRLDANLGTLEILVGQEELANRIPAASPSELSHFGMGRELFTMFRASATAAELGASSVASLGDA